MFAKLYERDGNQVLVFLDTKDDEPEIRYYFQPKGLGVCSVAISFGKSKHAFDDAEAAFDLTDEDIAYEAIKDAVEMAEQFSSGVVEAEDEGYSDKPNEI